MTQTKRERLGERKVLDYHDVLLREADVSLLEGPHWLNDQVVAFFLEYLAREELHGGGRSDESPTHAGGAAQAGAAPSAPATQPPPRPPHHHQGQGADSVLLLPPSTAFLLMHSPPEMAAEVLAPLKPAQKGLVVLPVNDNDDVDIAAGGSHWSLLVYHRPSNTLRHYDSSPCASAGGRNSWAARQLAEAVGPALSGGGASAASSPRLVEVSYMPRQTNGYDCGVYVLAVARAVCGWWMRGIGRGIGPEAAEGGNEAEMEGEWEAQERGMGGWLTPARVAGLRSEVLELIRARAAAAA